MGKKIVVARIKVMEDKVNAYLELVKPLIASTRAESGNEVYTLYQMPEDPTEFIFYEEYTDQAAFNAHGGSDHFKAFAAGVKPMLAAEMDIKVF
ncbi:antibiotic biosynthesis monooxygenase [Bacteroides sp. OttesenSCG-928-J23]|nr:antibiotic biosynthesis monooxygenase [Bacteroides sp. OttesenSCG-928-J23]MDL2247437.1 antibiotic biosynthesis monooxygenase [Bacteroides sp. OttesenSCG-928-J23]